MSHQLHECSHGGAGYAPAYSTYNILHMNKPPAYVFYMNNPQKLHMNTPQTLHILHLKMKMHYI